MFHFNTEKIKDIQGLEILDSRGNPTLRITIFTNKYSASFDVPSGASTGVHEAHELRDGEDRFSGKGVRKVLSHITEVQNVLRGMFVYDQKGIDTALIELDGTENKSRLGGNLIIGISVAVAKCAAQARGLEVFQHLMNAYDTASYARLPRLYMNMVNGGMHADSRLAFQEYMVVPKGDSIGEALEIGFAFQKELKKQIKQSMPGVLGTGDEGGFVIDSDNVRLPLEIFTTVAEELGITDRVEFALDVAASSFYKDKAYSVGGSPLSPDELLSLYKEMIAEYPLLSIEDPFEEEAFTDFAQLCEEYDMVVGDDLTVTNKGMLKRAVYEKSVDALIIKPNQVGTLTETVEAMQFAREHNVECIASHRSGETMDTFIADLAYAFGCFGIKAGALQRGERIAKYNRLLEIERIVKNK